MAAKETVDTIISAITPNQKTEKGESLEELVDSSTNDQVGSKTNKREILEDFIKKIMKSESVNYEDVICYSQLYIAVLQNDWKEAEDFIEKNPKALISIFSKLFEFFLNCIIESNNDDAIQLLQKCLGKVPLLVLEKVDSFGTKAQINTSFVGNIKVAKILVKRHGYSRNKKYCRLPVHDAAFKGHKEVVEYLLLMMKKSEEGLNSLAGESGYLLVDYLITANLYDMASDFLKGDVKLACEDELYWRGRILDMLATKPMIFKSGSRLGYWKRFIYHYIPVQQECIHDYPRKENPNDEDNDEENPSEESQNSSTKSSPFSFFGAWSQKLNIMLWKILLCRVRSIQTIHDKKLMHIHVVEIVKMMCAGDPWSFEQAIESFKRPILTAARLGIPEIVEEIIKAYPDSLRFVDEDGNNVLILAILHRHEKMFKLICQFGTMKYLKGNNMINKDLNNILHLAAKSVPASEIRGAALQMQRELQWFKAVKNFVQPTLQEERNKFDKTPKEIFSEEHKELIEKGEEWMKENAKFAVSIIITAVFAVTFTIPNVNVDKETPNFLQKLVFKIFMISDSLALFSSTTSLLIFLGIFTATYSEEDFLRSLPRKLIIGFITMFISIASIMVAFDATIYMVFSNPWQWVIIPFGCIPVTTFAMLQFPFLLEIYYSTYAPTLSEPKKNM